MLKDDYTKGQRVAIQPWSPFYMSGYHFGTVSLIGRKWIHVRLLGDRVVRMQASSIRPS